MQDLSYELTPSVAIFADDEWARDRLAALAEQVPARVAVRGGLGEACAILDARSIDAVLVEAGDHADPAFDRLLARLNGEASAERLESVVSITPALIDRAMAAAPHEGVALVCQGSELDRVAALSLALAERPNLLFEERAEDLSLQLRRVREEVGRIARALATVAGGDVTRAPAPAPVPEPTVESGTEPTATLLRRMIRVRRMREAYFQADLFADPAWDMLLDLTLARMEGRPVAVSSLCIAAAVPPTTALRWIKRLVDDGLFIRHADPLDGRRVFIDLSEAGGLAMMRYLRASVAAERTIG
jgi:hypothetical protein